MADRSAIDRIYEQLGFDLSDAESALSLYDPYVGRSYEPPRGKTIKSATYVPPEDKAGRNLRHQQELSRQRKSLFSRERLSKLISIGLPEDLSMVPCSQLRSAIGMLEVSDDVYDTTLKRDVYLSLIQEINRNINRRCERKLRPTQ